MVMEPIVHAGRDVVLKDEGLSAWIEKNKQWVEPYAAFKVQMGKEVKLVCVCVSVCFFVCLCVFCVCVCVCACARALDG